MLRRLSIVLLCATACACGKKQASDTDLQRASQTLDSIYKCFPMEGGTAMRASYSALPAAEESPAPADLRSYSALVSGVMSLMQVSADGGKQYAALLERQVLPGLERYYDTLRTPHAYASYYAAGDSSCTRSYGDNIRLGIYFADLYMMTGEQHYLDKALTLYAFAQSGMDASPEGGIFRDEQARDSKDTYSNASAAILLTKLFQITRDQSYLFDAQRQYDWTKQRFADPVDELYFDHIDATPRLDTHKHPCNSGLMLQAACLLYGITKDESYFSDALRTAESSLARFFTDFTTPEGKNIKVFRYGPVESMAALLEGYAGFYGIHNNILYLDAFRQSLDYAWTHVRDPQGLFREELLDRQAASSRRLADQAAMVEMYARMAVLNKYIATK